MKKILMRSAMPLDGGKNVSEILLHNLIGNNTGNLIFQTSVARTVMTEDVEITTIRTDRVYSDEQVEQWNAEYDLFLIPLANAFRITFMAELRILTDLVKRMKIPCVVVGVGMARKVNSRKWKFRYDDEAVAFTRAVLEKSPMVGLRGEITAEYLKRKGFVPEKDFTVIGCPSMYMYGDRLPELQKTELTPASKVTMNFKSTQILRLYRFLRAQGELFEHSVFVTQLLDEIQTLYVGEPFFDKELKKTIPEDYPMHFTSPLMRENRIAGVVDIPSWFSYLRGQDFNFGSRIHGNIAAILSGTPCYIIAGDCRVKELAQYHHIPHITVNDVTEETSVFSLYEQADYGQLFVGHSERLSRYLDFLDKSGVPHISREAMSGRDTPFDRRFGSREGAGIIEPFPVVSPEEQERRLAEYFRAYRNIRQTQAEALETRNRRAAALQEEVQALRRELAEIKSSRFYKMKNKYDAFRKR